MALIERHADPDAYKVLCTHFIQPSATPTIQRLGIAAALEAAGAVRNGLQLWARWGWIHAAVGEQPGRPTYGYSVRRQVLDPILRRATLDTPGVEFMPGQTARRLLAADGRIAEGCDAGAASRRVRRRPDRREPAALAGDARPGAVGQPDGARGRPSRRSAEPARYSAIRPR